MKEIISGKKVAEVIPRTLLRVARPSQGWLITRQLVLEQQIRKESGASSPS